MLRLTLGVLLLLSSFASLSSQEVPQWILRGILMRETSSYYDNGNIVYVNTVRGSHGERGPFQMQKICFDQVSKQGESFDDVETNMKFAEETEIRYLVYLYNYHNNHDWEIAIGMNNTGPSNYYRYPKCAKRYYEAIKKLGE